MSTSELSRNGPQEEHSSRTGGSRLQPKPQRKRRRRKRPLILTILLRFFQILFTLILIGIVTGCFVACYGVFYINSVIIPNAGLDLSQYTMDQSSTIYYTDPTSGQDVEMLTLYSNQDREWIDFDDIPKNFINAAVAIEDERFWTHQGVDWKRTAAAVYYMFTGRTIQGGSTITQQLIKNLTQQDEVTVKRKIGEIFNALEFEKHYDKNVVLTWYLNYIYLGKGKYGIVTASQYYFGKEVSEITLAEAASIIAITNSPAKYGPASGAAAIENNKYRQGLILDKMLELGMITESECRAAKAEPLNFVFDANQDTTNEVRTWYEEQAIREVRDYLVENYHYSAEFASRLISSQGWKIYTAFDPRVQDCVDQIYLDRSNLDYVSKDGQLMQSAITVVDNSTGSVVAIGGAMGEKTGNLWTNHATSSRRQPGSSIKPLSAYSPAIEMGLVTPYSVIDDSPLQMLNGKPWPRNDGGSYRGLVTVQQGITSSLNTIASKLVGEIVTPDASYQFLEDRYGLTLVDNLESGGQVKNDHGVAQLALGGLTRGLTTYEMAAAYATFPRGGMYTSPSVVLRVETRDGDVIWDNTPQSEPIIKETTAWYMNTMLYHAANEGTGRGAIFSGQPIAGKTGTTTDNFDRWFAGYTPYYTAVVWTGYERNAKMSTQGNPASTMWRKVMTLVHEGLERKEFFTYENTTRATICLDCGKLATEACSGDMRGGRAATYTFAAGDAPTGYCTCHVPITVCRASRQVDEEGNVTGAYYKAGEFCPADTVSTVYVVDYHRTGAAASVAVGDSRYMASNYANLGPCPVHTEAQVTDPFEGFDWTTFNPDDPATWPFDSQLDPSEWPFDPSDSTTWPDAALHPETPEEPGTGEAPAVHPEDPEGPGESEGPIISVPPIAPPGEGDQPPVETSAPVESPEVPVVDQPSQSPQPSENPPEGHSETPETPVTEPEPPQGEGPPIGIDYIPAA